LRNRGRIRTGNLRRHVVSQAFVAQNGRLTTRGVRTPAVLLAEHDRPGVEPEPCGLPCIPTGIRQPKCGRIRSVGGARLCRAHFAGRAGASAASISELSVRMLTPFASLRSEVGSTESRPTQRRAASKRVSKIKLGPTSRDAETGHSTDVVSTAFGPESCVSFQREGSREPTLTAPSPCLSGERVGERGWLRTQWHLLSPPLSSTPSGREGVNRHSSKAAFF
jgi:hypothetical protein